MKNKKEEVKQKNASSPLPIFIIFIIIITFILLLPEIYKKNDIKNNDTYQSDKNENKENITQEDDKSPMSQYCRLDSDNILEYNEIELTDISLTEDKKLTFNVKTAETVNLDDLEYYVEFYIDKTTFIGRRALHGKVTKSQKISIDISNMPIDASTYIAVSHITSNSIKPLDMTTDESGLATLSCSKNEETYEYEFNLKKLSKVRYKYTYTNPDLEEFAKSMLEAQKKEKTYNGYNGVTASITDNQNSYIFLSEFAYDETSSFEQLGDSNIFDKGTPNNIVKFKMEAEGFECK